MIDYVLKTGDVWFARLPSSMLRKPGH